MRVYNKWNCVNTVENEGQLQDILHKHGIKYGIDDKAIKDFALKYSNASNYSTDAVNVLVAKGKAPKDGKDGIDVYGNKIHAKAGREKEALIVAAI